MDYLVFGVGFGSTLVLLGWVLRQFGPTFRYRNTPEDVLSAEALLERNDWQRFCIAMGALLSVCGAAMLLITLITLLIRPSDRVGTIVVGVIFTLSLVAVAGWIVMYVQQHRALAGDRRAEALAATRDRRPDRTRPATAAMAKADVAPVAASASGEAVNAAEGLEDLARRRAAAQGQQRAAGPRQGEPRPRIQRTQPLEHEQQETPTTVLANEAPAEWTPPEEPASPATALRNVQFKRASTSRSQGTGRPDRTATAHLSSAAADDPAGKGSSTPELNGPEANEGAANPDSES